MLWLKAAGLLGLKRWIWIAIVAAALGAAVLIAGRTVDRVLESATEAGKAAQRAENAEATLNQVEKANDASQDLQRDPGAARDECLRHARNPADC